MKIVISNRQLRDLSLALHLADFKPFLRFFYPVLIDGLNYSETQSGSIFAISAFMAIVARIFGAI